MTRLSPFVGIDVAKADLVVAIQPPGERWVVANDDAGVTQLVRRLRRLAPALVGLLTRRRQVLDILVAERNRLTHALPAIRRDITQHIRWLERRVGASSGVVARPCGPPSTWPPQSRLAKSRRSRPSTSACSAPANRRSSRSPRVRASSSRSSTR